MPTQAGMATSFNLPNYVGEVFTIARTRTPFLSMIGGLTGGLRSTSALFAWNEQDLPAAAQPAILEGADPSAEEYTLTQSTNVVQIFQEAISVSYSRQGNTGQLDGASILGNVAAKNPLDYQVKRKLQKIARDIEYTFLLGTYQNPADNTTARKTRGMLSAISTAVTDLAGATLQKKHIDDVLKSMYDAGAHFNEPVIFVNSFNKQQISNSYGYAPADRNIGGVNVQQIETDFGNVGVKLDPFMPQDQVLVADVAVCAPVMLMIPGKGFMFREPLARTGASLREQIYGETGLHYGPEVFHGKLINTATS